ncbi:Fic family protein [Xanthovirga aplysinae]|uniref:Fic family protein n=1 Tax=Xanthovirga aplysinae TaxID=2529853 RepID=UPI0012BD4AA6|nr:Fic family protein [Xanthovirga aplysinae]MTI31350.1 cell filamentation protein Fic [Xanthovirga aplysinae]
MNQYFSQKVNSFHDRETPEEGTLVGYSFLINLLEKEYLQSLPLPDQLAIVTEKHQRYNTKYWQVFTKRHKPKDNIGSHLVFALKYEGIDLFLLKTFFKYSGERQIIELMKKEPTGQYARRLWFLYEWLMGQRLQIADLKTGSYVELLNSKLQYPGLTINSTRHRIKNNLPGVPEFCPLIKRTEKLEQFRAKGLSSTIEKGLSKQDKELVRRTAAFLLLKDSRASFAIEGEYPPSLRARNWGKAIGQAGKKELSILEIERLQHLVIGSKKLKNMGIRKNEGFIGEHDRETLSPIPDHISAKVQDLPILMAGLMETNRLLEKANYDPVLAAATIAFGFVFIHPLSDGNGRIHRYIIHHILAKSGYAKREMIFPVSTAILERIGEYQNILESHSHPRLDLIKWKETPDHNLKIHNETIDLYRYYDLTPQAEFLYECVEDTIIRIIPEELDYLKKYDRMSYLINEQVTLPDNKVDLLIKLLIQNSGTLSKAKRQKEFSELTTEELMKIEMDYKEIWGK